MNELSTLAGSNLAIPAYARATQGSAGVTLVDVLGGSYTAKNRVTVKNGHFHQILAGIAGASTPGPLRAVILGVFPATSRQFYLLDYQQGQGQKQKNTGPDCYSADGAAPSPHAKVPQSSSCSTCPQNIKGDKGKPCATFQRLAIRIVGDDTRRLYVYDAPGMTLFGDDSPTANRYNLKNYGQYIAAHGVSVDALMTDLHIDMSASVSKVVFSPAGFVPESEYLLDRNEFDAETREEYVQIEYGLPSRVGGAVLTAPVTTAVSPAATTPVPPTPAPAPASGFGTPAPASGFGTPAPASGFGTPPQGEPSVTPVSVTGLVAASVDDVLNSLV